MERPSYESSLPIINREIAKRKSKWKLTSIAWMDFYDVEQKLRLHIFRKWDKWNPEMGLLPWLNTVITNQIINLVRNNYSNYARPCLNCPHNGGGSVCKLYTAQTSQCAEYAKWERTKKHAYDVKLPSASAMRGYSGKEMNLTQKHLPLTVLILSISFLKFILR